MHGTRVPTAATGPLDSVKLHFGVWTAGLIINIQFESFIQAIRKLKSFFQHRMLLVALTVIMLIVLLPSPSPQGVVAGFLLFVTTLFFFLCFSLFILFSFSPLAVPL